MIDKLTGRNREILRARQVKQEHLAQETVIMQKVNHAYREAFRERFPGQVEHVLRLLSERLQMGLDKRDNVVVDDVTTWKLSPSDINQLASALHNVYQIHRDFQNASELTSLLDNHFTDIE
jgi:hypothetical protein